MEILLIIYVSLCFVSYGVHIGMDSMDNWAIFRSTFWPITLMIIAGISIGIKIKDQ